MHNPLIVGVDVHRKANIAFRWISRIVAISYQRSAISYSFAQ